MRLRLPKIEWSWSLPATFILLFVMAGAPFPFGSTNDLSIAFWCLCLGVASIFDDVERGSPRPSSTRPWLSKRLETQPPSRADSGLRRKPMADTSRHSSFRVARQRGRAPCPIRRLSIPSPRLPPHTQSWRGAGELGPRSHTAAPYRPKCPSGIRDRLPLFPRSW